VALDGVEQIAERGQVQLFVQDSQLLELDCSRFEQPSEIGGQLGNRELDRDPGAGMELPEPPDHGGINVERRLVEPGNERFV
jgi:hypothetical protein